MRPASIFEKFLLAFVIVSVLFPVMYTLFYSLLSYPSVLAAKAMYVAPKVCKTCPVPIAPDFGFYFPFFTSSANPQVPGIDDSFLARQIYDVLVLWSIQAIIVSGTVFFKRSALLWTALLSFILMIVISASGVTPMLGVFGPSPLYDNVPHQDIEKWFSIVLWIGLPVLTWGAVFFHLKEREVA